MQENALLALNLALFGFILAKIAILLIMLNESNRIILRDTPLRLVLKIIVLQLISSLLYLVIAIVSNYSPSFDEGLLWGIITYDVFTFTSIVVLQQLIVLYWLLKWFMRSYTFSDQELFVKEGIFFRKHLVIPLRSIKSVRQHHDRLGKLLHYSTITISLINSPNAVVMPHMTDPEQILNYLGFDE